MEATVIREYCLSSGMAQTGAVSRAVILDDGKILLIHRIKDGREYFVLPGGHVEEGESEEETLIREIKEETSLDICIDKRLWTLKNPSDGSDNHFFLVTSFSGVLALGGPELEKNSEENKYILEWHDLSEIPGLNMVPEPVKMKIVASFPGR